MADTYALPQPFEEIDHTADVGVRVHGATPDECLARMVLAFTALTLGAPIGDDAQPEHPRTLEIDPDDPLTMIVDVIRELLYVFDTEHLLPTRCTVNQFDAQTGTRLELVLRPVDETLHEDITDLKAVTWHEAKLEAATNGWMAQIIFDV